jgi:hypothetical protein
MAFPVLEQIERAGEGNELRVGEGPAGRGDQAAVEELEVEDLSTDAFDSPG